MKFGVFYVKVILAKEYYKVGIMIVYSVIAALDHRI